MARRLRRWPALAKTQIILSKFGGILFDFILTL